MTIHWLLALHGALLKANRNYRDTHIVLEDNAPTHVAKTTKAVQNYYGIRTMQSAIASFESLPVEGTFRTLKAKVNYNDDILS